jgi:hypothetical protein
MRGRIQDSGVRCQVSGVRKAVTRDECQAEEQVTGDGVREAAYQPQTMGNGSGASLKSKIENPKSYAGD